MRFRREGHHTDRPMAPPNPPNSSSPISPISFPNVPFPKCHLCPHPPAGRLGPGGPLGHSPKVNCLREPPPLSPPSGPCMLCVPIHMSHHPANRRRWPRRPAGRLGPGGPLGHFPKANALGNSPPPIHTYMVVHMSHHPAGRPPGPRRAPGAALGRALMKFSKNSEIS